jgi:predicted nucleic acid-binding protein
MKRVFADTAYFVALVRKRDQLHRQASYFQEHPPGKLLTTEWVLTEAGNTLAKPTRRLIGMQSAMWDRQGASTLLWRLIIDVTKSDFAIAL